MRETYLETALALTDEIEVKQNELIELNNNVEDTRGRIALREADIVVAIAAEQVEGKAKYSNEGARSAELAKRKAADNGITGLQSDLSMGNTYRIQLSNEITKLQSQVSLYKAFLNGSD